LGGAHRDPAKAAQNLERWITDQLHELKAVNPATLPNSRYDRFRKLGSFTEMPAA
jgi:acetyl-CoA carboxylase carboxyl transferase subunit alpha